MSISVVSPVGEFLVMDTPYDLAIGRAGFAGRVGVLANSQPGSRHFVEWLADALQVLVPSATFACDDKGLSPAGSSMVMDEEELLAVVDRFDAVALAYGHCGGCTAATVRDAVAIARRGIPVVALVVPRFAEQARLVARAAGMAEVPVHVLPGPMTQLPFEARAFAARDAAPQVLDLLTRRAR